MEYISRGLENIVKGLPGKPFYNVFVPRNQKKKRLKVCLYSIH